MKIQNIILILKKLKNKGAVAIKQSFEDEGASFEEIKLMKKIVKKVGLKHNIKIGGCEAKNDINFCSNLKVDGIVAPMVESRYALDKFFQSIPQNNLSKLYVNIETISALKNLRKIFTSKYIDRLYGIIFGRSDIVGSLGLKKKDVNSKKITKLLLKSIKFVKKKNKKLVIKVGGSVTLNSKTVFEYLFKKNLIDSTETRNIEIQVNKKSLDNFKELIILAFEFEVAWIKYKLKNKFFDLKSSERKFFNRRIIEINKRIKLI